MDDGRCEVSRWVEVRRTFTAPVSTVKSATGYDTAELDRIIYGFTVIEYHDAKGRRRPKFVDVIGDQS